MKIETTMSLSERGYRLLLKLYPASFRREYGEDMAQAFRDLSHAAAQGSMMRMVLGLWPRILWDVLHTAIQQHLSEALKKRGHSVDTQIFDRQLGGTVDSMTVLLRAGYSVMQCLSMIADQSPEPTASAFKQFVSDVQSGKSAVEALNGLKARIPSSHLAQVIETMLRQRETGGNLAKQLEPVADAIRQNAGSDGTTDTMLDHFRQITTPNEN